MANNYMLSSSSIDIGGADQNAILAAMIMIEKAHELYGTGDPDDKSVDDVDAFIKSLEPPGDKPLLFDNLDTKKRAQRVMKVVKSWKLEWEYLGFDWQLDAKDIWVKADESIDVDSAVRCLQLLATVVPEMQSAAPWYMTWACTCSKMRVDEFDGGAVVFTHRRAKWMNSSSWASRTVEQFKKQMKKGKK